ncbi:MAG: hypothetical protein L0H93_16295, partial [Nocardioides sp.]|nr:hypothetical protein [Nocardioides sp.]
MSNDQPPYGSGPNPHGDPGEEPTRHVTRPPQQTPPGQGQAPGQPQQYGGAAYGSQGGDGNQDPGHNPRGTGDGPSGPRG